MAGVPDGVKAYSASGLDILDAVIDEERHASAGSSDAGDRMLVDALVRFPDDTEPVREGEIRKTWRATGSER